MECQNCFDKNERKKIIKIKQEKKMIIFDDLEIKFIHDKSIRLYKALKELKIKFTMKLKLDTNAWQLVFNYNLADDEKVNDLFESQNIYF